MSIIFENLHLLTLILNCDRRTNNIARHQNSSVTRPGQHLAVLHSYSDNIPIPNFPETPADIPGLTSKFSYGFSNYRLLMTGKYDL